MTIRNLDAVLAPKSLVLITGPSPSGGIVARNLLDGGYAGCLWHVGNTPLPARFTAIPALRALREKPDLAVIAGCTARLPELIHDLGAAGVRAAIVCDPLEGDGRLRQALLDASRPHLLRILGPSSLGAMVPGIGLNASTAPLAPLPGKLALVAQSGSVIASVLDWARPRGIGFSKVVALGEMLDVDFGDALDYLGRDAETTAILLYIETITHARKFMSAGRGAARIKPVIALEAASGVNVNRDDGARMITEEAVYDAALRRAGIVRVATLDELFEAAAVLASSRRPDKAVLTIVTNGGGMAAIARDTLHRLQGQLAVLPVEMQRQLAAVLPPAGKPANPLDLGDLADPALYGAVLDVLLSRPESGAVLVAHCPTAVASSLDYAQAVADGARRHPGRVVLAAWPGDETGTAGLRLLARHGIPAYAGPDHALRAFMHLVHYDRAQETLMETPRSVPGLFEAAPERAAQVVGSALAAGRQWLTVDENRALLEAYAIRVCDGAERRGANAELMAGIVADPVFGPLVMFGRGGCATERIDDKVLALPPLNLALARDLVDRVHVARLLSESDEANAVLEALQLLLVKLAQLAADIPQIELLDLNPVLAGPAGVFATAVRCRAAQPAPRKQLAILPYPRELEQDVRLGDGRRLWLRPIMPEDEPALRASFAKLTPEEIRLRFFAQMRSLPHKMAARMTQIDYDREMALVLTEHAPAGSADIFGVVRIVADPDRERAEFAILVRHDMAGLGLGAALMRRIIDYARARGIGELFGEVLPDNSGMLALGGALGFRQIASPDDPELVRLVLPLRDPAARAGVTVAS